MKTLRHYFVSQSLDDLEELERQLESNGLTRSQIHVLSNDSVGLANHKDINSVKSLFRNDAVHSAFLGAGIGLVIGALMLTLVYFSGLPQLAGGWIPYVFLAVVIFGFCTWEGGLIGIQQPNIHFKRFEQELDAGNHVFIVTTDSRQEAQLEAMLVAHPDLKAKGTEMGYPNWTYNWVRALFNFIDRNLLSFAQVRS